MDSGSARARGLGVGSEELDGVIFAEYEDGRSGDVADGGGSGGVAWCLNAGAASGGARRGAAK